MKSLCTYTQTTKLVADKANEMWTSVTKLVSDKLSETTTKLMANYRAKYCRIW